MIQDMENLSEAALQQAFYSLKVKKIDLPTKQLAYLTLEVPEELKKIFQYRAGQYLTFKYTVDGGTVYHDYSMASAPYEGDLSFGIRINSEDSDAAILIKNAEVGSLLSVSAPKGRFTVESKPHEFRTIVGFAAGIGITPVISHLKNILHNEPRTRFYLFYSNRTPQDTAYAAELEVLKVKYGERLSVFNFYSRDSATKGIFAGRLDSKRIHLIINQFLHLDDTDEESTIWDSVDHVLICGPGEMIKEVANACYEQGILKQHIHFELFGAFNDDIYPQEITAELVENIELTFTLNGKTVPTTLPDNRNKILQQLLLQQYAVPYSCKSGICGSCMCQLEYGEVELFENEYLTKKEAEAGKILACMAIPASKAIKINFDV